MKFGANEPPLTCDGTRNRFQESVIFDTGAERRQKVSVDIFIALDCMLLILKPDASRRMFGSASHLPECCDQPFVTANVMREQYRFKST
jgi:hypothetical protein